jgi:outer membrane protein assembly factor BamB
MNDEGELAAPTIYNGVMYVINGKWTFAIDVETGKQIWRTPVILESGIQRSAFNRGAATIYNGKLFRVTIDNHLLALDMQTGEVLWKSLVQTGGWRGMMKRCNGWSRSRNCSRDGTSTERSSSASRSRLL